ncbi:MAG: hypothetical protein QOF89_3047 [Acidobacteriota bacterium]|jgi:hypothetical protein|nr:hypothetical protein [Acidobacteriota bacterium]
MVSQESPLGSPPTLRVGVTGHRTKGLSEAGYDQALLRGSVRKVLAQVKEIARRLSERHPDVREELLLKVVSPLAEGADRIVAEEGLMLGYELQSPLPFSRQEYEKDFTIPESKTAFHALLERTTQVIELAGSREHENKAYEEVGRWVLLHSDILIAIWNGQSPAGQGGTGQIVKEAIARGITTVWVRPHEEIFLLRSIAPLLYDSMNGLSEAIGRVLTARGMS